MAVTATAYHNFMLGQLSGVANGVVDLDTDTIKVALAASTYTPAAATHDFFNDVTNEVTGTNYTAGGITLTGVTVALNAGVVTFDANDVTWTAHASGFANARYAIIYKSTGTASTSRLISYVDFGADVGNTVTDLQINWNASGILRWTLS